MQGPGSGRETGFWVVPAIDLLDGRVVRLIQGDYGQVRHYGLEPAVWARQLAEAGAPRLHVIDLSGAREGRPRHLPVVARIVGEAGVPVQLGGGLRSLAAIEQALAAGVDCVILGSAALDAGLVGEALARWGSERIWAAIDIRGERVAVAGWQEARSSRPVELARRLADLGVRWAVVTDTRRDGTLVGPNVEAAMEVAAAGLRVVVAGGVASARDVETVAARARQAAVADAAGKGGLAGVVVGRALYEGRLSLSEALAAAEQALAKEAGRGREG